MNSRKEFRNHSFNITVIKGKSDNLLATVPVQRKRRGEELPAHRTKFQVSLLDVALEAQGGTGVAGCQERDNRVVVNIVAGGAPHGIAGAEVNLDFGGGQRRGLDFGVGRVGSREVEADRMVVAQVEFEIGLEAGGDVGDRVGTTGVRRIVQGAGEARAVMAGEAQRGVGVVEGADGDNSIQGAGVVDGGGARTAGAVPQRGETAGSGAGTVRGVAVDADLGAGTFDRVGRGV